MLSCWKMAWRRSKGLSFYRALDCEREAINDEVLDEEYVDNKPEVASPEPTKKEDSPLKKLRDWFEEYLKELPVLGFNSAKYDMNAIKEQVQFTVATAISRA